MLPWLPYVPETAARGKATLIAQYLNIAREIGDRRGEGNALYNTGLALDELGDRAKAIAHAEAALEIYERIESPAVEGLCAALARWRGEA